METEKKIIIIGAGPAGLAAGYELSRNGTRVLLLEQKDSVGGLSRTTNYKGHLFDVGPHRFFTKNKEINDLWHKVLGADSLNVPRLTRIFYRRKFFAYPVKPFDVLLKIGFADSVAVCFSYLRNKLFLKNAELKTFEDWTVNNFGRKLFEIFFKTYTEKVWGIPCNQISAEWASQRIKNLSLWAALRHAISKDKKKVKSLVEEFKFPKLGAGLFYEKMANEIKNGDGEILCGQKAISIVHKNNRVVSVIVRGSNGEEKEWVGDHFLFSLPLTEFVRVLSPELPSAVRAVADNLYFRGHISVNLIIKKLNIFPDNWIYIQDPDIKMGRIANYRNFSKEMVRGGYAPITCEYFAFKDDELWRQSDGDLKKLAVMELEMMGFLKESDVIDGSVSREEFAYPVYYLGYKESLDRIKDSLDYFENIQLIGRGGTYRYNNQDHSLLSGVLAARNILGENHDIWSINADSEYYESADERLNKC